MIKKLSKNKIIRFLTSYQLAVVCLFFLMVLTFWGTLYQIENGLYITQSRMFNSWYFTFFNYFPFPGARTILWISLVNITLATIFRFQYKWNKTGIWFIHLGLILLIISGGITLHFAQESNLTLNEGEGANVSADYHEWELAFWTQSAEGDSTLKEVESFSFASLKKGQVIDNSRLGLKATIQEYYPNSQAFRGNNLLPSDKFVNASGIAQLKGSPANGDPANNIPGIIFSVEPEKERGLPKTSLLLFGGEMTPTSITLNGKRVYCHLRRKHYELPLTLTLIDFIKKDHLGINMAKSFESRVVIDRNNFKRELVISMNQPLRVDNFTFYQSSFSQSGMGETSTLAVVENPGRVLPYVSSIVVGVGLIIHCLIMLLKYIARSKRKSVAKGSAV